MQNARRWVAEHYRQVGVLAVIGAGSIARAEPTTPAAIVTAMDLDSLVTTMQGFVTATIAAVGPSLVLILGIVGAFFFVWNRIRSLF